MRRSNKGFISTKSRNNGRDERPDFRNRLSNKMLRLKKLHQCYKTQKSNYPDDEGKYIVIYESETARGCNYKKVFKGEYRECKDLEKELNLKLLEG